MTKRPPTYDLATLDGFVSAWRSAGSAQAAYNANVSVGVGDLWCPRCGGPRRVALWATHVNRIEHSWPHTAEQLTPSLWTMCCVQCHLFYHAAIVASGSGPLLLLSPGIHGGRSTPHTPDIVRYFLDEAARCEISGAIGAAITAYRSAVEAVLYQQGFDERMLGPKLGQLEQAIKDGKAPAWAATFPQTFLQVLGKLGNATTHSDGVTVEQYEATLSTRLLAEVHITIAELLDAVYERPERAAARLAELQRAHGDLKPPRQAGKPATK